MKERVKKIDLYLPTGWGTATTEELEIIAAAIISEQAATGRYRVFDWERVKLNVVLAINGISVVGRDDDENHALQTDGEITKGDESTWLVQRQQDSEPWEISAGQMLALTERLGWIDDNNIKSPIFHFPYPEMKVAQTEVAGPPPLMDGYTWREYRQMQDWMTTFLRLNNSGKDSTEARSQFLALLFKRQDESAVPASTFNGFSPVQWQVILFWWSSLMHILQGKFPRVFKKQPVGKGKKKKRRQQAGTEWDFYNSVTASIQKYIGGLSAQDVDSQPYGVTLQQLEMMAKESEEMERLKKK